MAQGGLSTTSEALIAAKYGIIRAHMETLYTVLAIAACILLFSFAIFIHEFGHFLAARWRGLKVDAFSIGFGPVIWRKVFRGVEWRISAIPFGGYVSIPDVDPEGTAKMQGTEAERHASASVECGESSGDSCATDDPSLNHQHSAPTFKSATPMDSIIVAVAGPLGNVVLAVLLAFALAAIPGARFGEMLAVIGEVPPEGPAHEAGVKAGDRVVSIGGVKVRTWTEMQTEIQISGGKPVDFVVDRNGIETKLSVTPMQHKASGAYYILALSTTNEMQAAAWMPSRNPLKQLLWDMMSIARVLKALVTPKESKAAAQALGGPVMIAEGLYRQVRNDVWDAFGFLRFLCVNLAILNLLPIPVLDGSIVMFALFALIFGRRPNERFVNVVTQVFMYLLIAAMLFLVYRDTVRSWRIHHDDGAEIAEKVKEKVK